MKRLVFAILVLCFFFSKAQTTLTLDYQSVDLKEVLLDIESKTSLTFSFSETVVDGKKVTLLGSAMQLSEVLQQLSSQTGLQFERISENQVIIRAPSTKKDICGYLFDGARNTPLANATILLTGTTIGVASDENGYFHMQDVDKDQNILIQYIGFSDKVLEISEFDSENCQNIRLTPAVESLEEVVVLAYLTKGIDKNADGSFTLNNAQLGILPGLVEPDVFQSIQLIPGISSLDESASGIQIRGGSPDQNLIYFDGIKMYNTGHFFGMISAFNPYITERAKIFKGGASPEYGDRISGVLDITTEEQIPEKTNGGFGLNGTQTDGFLKAALGKKVGLILSARRSYTDLLETPTYNALSDKVFQNTRVVTNTLGEVLEDDDEASEVLGGDTFFFYDGSAKLLVQPSENDKISVSGLFTKNDLDFFARDEEDITQDRLIVENKGASFEWSGTKFEKWEHSIKGYYSSFNSDYNNLITEDQTEEERNFRRNQVEDYGLDVNITYSFLPRHSIKLGYQYSNLDVFFELFRDEAGDADIEPEDNEDIPLPAETRDFNVERSNTNQSNTFYGEYIYNPSNKGHVSLGIRGSHYSLVDDLFIEPRLNIEYPISSKFRLKGTAERRFQPVSQLIEFEDTQLRLENNIWTLSDGDEIPILESTQFSGGFLFDSNGWTLEVDGYVKKIKGLTSFTNGFTNAAEELSQGESDINGVDVLLRKKIKNYRVWLGYTFNDVEYSFEELQTTPFPGNNDITHNLRISNTLEMENWEFSLGWTYRTGSPFTTVDDFSTVTGDIDFAAVNSERLPGYHRLDASILYSFGGADKKGPRGTFGLSVQNIYDRQIPISVFYRVDDNPETGLLELNRIEQLSLGFTPNATLRFFF